MVTEQEHWEWHEELEDTRIELEAANRLEDKARRAHAESRVLHDRTERFVRRPRSAMPRELCRQQTSSAYYMPPASWLAR